MNGSRWIGLVLMALGAMGAKREADDLPRMTRLADGVYMYEHHDPTKAGVHQRHLSFDGHGFPSEWLGVLRRPPPA